MMTENKIRRLINDVLEFHVDRDHDKAILLKYTETNSPWASDLAEYASLREAILVICEYLGIKIEKFPKSIRASKGKMPVIVKPK